MFSTNWPMERKDVTNYLPKVIRFEFAESFGGCLGTVHNRLLSLIMILSLFTISEFAGISKSKKG